MSHISSSRASLWSDANFNIFWIAQALDSVGDSFAKIALPLLVLDTTNSVAQMGFVTAIIGISSLASSIISTFFIDRIERRKLMILCDLTRVIFYTLIPFCWQLLGPTVWLLYFVVAVTASSTTIFLITYTAAIPNLVKQEQIIEANARIQVTVGLAYVAGPMLAGFAYSKLDASIAIGMIALFYITSTLLILFVQMRQINATPANSSNDEKIQNRSLLQDLISGISFLLHHPVLKWVTLLFAMFVFVSEATIDLTIFRLKHDLYQSQSSIGIVFGAGSFGAVIAGSFAHFFRRKWGFGLSFLGGLLLQGIAIVAIGLAPTVPTVATLIMIFTFGLMIRNINTMSLRQQVTPNYLLGRVSSAFWTIVLVLGPIGVVTATVVAEKIGATPVLILMGVLSILVVMIGFFTPANAQKPELIGEKV